VPDRIVYLDTNVFIAAFETADGPGYAARRLLTAAENARLRIVTSELTLSDVLVGPLRRGDDALAALYRSILVSREGFAVVPIDRVVLEAAAQLRAGHGTLRLPDAIHRATADLSTCTAVATADLRLPLAAGQRRIDLDDVAVTAFLDPPP